MIAFRTTSAWAYSLSVSSMGLSRESSSNLVMIGLRVLWTATGSTMCHLRVCAEPVGKLTEARRFDAGPQLPRPGVGLDIKTDKFIWNVRNWRGTFRTAHFVSSKTLWVLHAGGADLTPPLGPSLSTSQSTRSSTSARPTLAVSSPLRSCTSKHWSSSGMVVESELLMSVSRDRD